MNRKLFLVFAKPRRARLNLNETGRWQVPADNQQVTCTRHHALSNRPGACCGALPCCLLGRVQVVLVLQADDQRAGECDAQIIDDLRLGLVMAD